MRKLKIAVLASNFIRIPPRPKDVPPQCSGAPEKMAYLISEGLIKRGHKIWLFASGDSKTSGKLISVTKRATGTDPKIGFIPGFFHPKFGPIPSSRFHEPYEYLLISKCYQMAKEGYFDLIHSHFDFQTAFFASLVKTPTVCTLHSPLAGLRKIILEKWGKNQYYISISNSQRNPLPQLPYLATIYHGVNIEKIPFSRKSENYLVFSGRIHPSKGTKEAILVAKKLKMKLIIMGKHGEEVYWKKEIKPKIDGKRIIYKGFLEEKKMFKILKKARAFLLPLQWEEPFGLTMIESMACGTPVIAFDRGSAKEIIKDGETGFLVKNLEEMIKSVKNVGKIKREKCRKYVKENFSLEKMVENYERAFYKLLK
jgi:glycosyltransferase involved in cell wall biosynthesis